MKIRTQADWEKHLEELYSSAELKKGNRTHFTFNELVHALRMDKTVPDYNISVKFTFDSKWVCIPGVKECFVPVRYLQKNVVSVELDLDFLDECEGMVPLTVELTDSLE